MLLRRRIVFTVSFVLTGLLHAQVSVLTWHNDQARTGQNLSETILTPVNVSSTQVFGRLFTIAVDGKVDAQPLYVPSLTIPSQGVHNVLYVVTEHNSAYAFDADNGTQLWKTVLSLTNETTSDDRGCGQVTPEIGITATPVIDPQSGPHGTIYMIAMSKDNAGNYHHRLHALDLTTGGEEFSGPKEVAATWPGTGDGSSGGTLTFDPKKYKERPALLLSGGIVYTTWSSHCDSYPYTGWVMGYNETTLAQVSLLNLTPNGGDGAMWNAGAGPATDATGNIFVMIGNGTFDTTLNGSSFPSNGDFGNAFVRLVPGSGSLTVADYFTMDNTVSESGGDVDLGSGGMLLTPSVIDSKGHSRNLLVGAGKDTHIYVVDRTNMGKFNPNSNNIFQDIQGAIGGGGVWSSPAWFNGTLYYAAVNDSLKAFPFVNGSFATTAASQSVITYPYPGATPAISANGIENAIVWAVENSDTATLHAFDANNLATELYNSNMAAGGRDHFGAGNKFIVPTIANGKVYVGTTASVGVFGLFCSGTLSADAHVAVGGGGGSVTVTVPSGCNWTAQSNAGFVSLTGATGGTNNGNVTYSVAANTGAPRTGTLSIAGRTFTITQDGLALSFVPTTPCRVVDTRYSNGAFGSPSLVAGATRSFTIPSSSCGIPTSAAAYSLNVAVVPKGTLGYLTIWPSGQTQPVVSTINSLEGHIKSVGAVIPSGAGGAISVYATNNTDLVLDVDGYFVPATTPSTLAFYPVTPCRVADTRNPNAPLGGPYLSAKSTRAFPVLEATACNIPASAQAYSVNLAVVPRGGPVGYLTAWSYGQDRPVVASLNDPTGTILSNAAIVPTDASGQINMYVTNDTDLVIDINGYFAPPGSGGLSLYNLAPCRVLDTRQPSGNPPFSGTMSVNVTASACSVPGNAQAYIFNATLVPPGKVGYLTLWPQGIPRPVVANLNDVDATINGNMAVVPTNNGSISAYVTSPTQLVLDIFGYFGP